MCKIKCSVLSKKLLYEDGNWRKVHVKKLKKSRKIPFSQLEIITIITNVVFMVLKILST